MAAKNPQQMAFLRQVIDLLNFAWAYCTIHKYSLVLGECYRSDEEQERLFNAGVSRIKTRGTHGWRMAIDLVIIVDGQICSDEIVWQPIGDFWKSLSQRNRWGGDFSFNDYGHFERTLV